MTKLVGRNRVLNREFRVFIGIPTAKDRHMALEALNFCTKAYQRRIAEYRQSPSAAPEVGRNCLIEAFLSEPKLSQATHLFLMDADSPPENEFAIEKLLSWNKPFVAGITPIWIGRGENETAIEDKWSAFPLPEPGQPLRALRFDDELPRGLFKADRVGGTCLLIRRDVLQVLTPPYQRCLWNDHMTNYELSEDLYFTMKIREAGFDLWVDPEVRCQHWHNFNLLNIWQWTQLIGERAKRLERENAQLRAKLEPLKVAV